MRRFELLDELKAIGDFHHMWPMAMVMVILYRLALAVRRAAIPWRRATDNSYQLRLITSLLADMATSGRACCRGSCLAAGRGQRSGR